MCFLWYERQKNVQSSLVVKLLNEIAALFPRIMIWKGPARRLYTKKVPETPESCARLHVSTLMSQMPRSLKCITLLCCTLVSPTETPLGAHEYLTVKKIPPPPHTRQVGPPLRPRVCIHFIRDPKNQSEFSVTTYVQRVSRNASSLSPSSPAASGMGAKEGAAVSCSRVMSHLWIDHVTHANSRIARSSATFYTQKYVTLHMQRRNRSVVLNQSCHPCKSIMSPLWCCHVTLMNRSCHPYELDMSDLWIGQVTYESVMSLMNQTRHESVMSWVSHVTRTN